jgi:hypothetical protein
MRARSVGKDYRKFIELKENWRKNELKVRD